MPVWPTPRTRPKTECHRPPRPKLQALAVLAATTPTGQPCPPQDAGRGREPTNGVVEVWEGVLGKPVPARTFPCQALQTSGQEGAFWRQWTAIFWPCLRLPGCANVPPRCAGLTLRQGFSVFVAERMHFSRPSIGPSAAEGSWHRERHNPVGAWHGLLPTSQLGQQRP